MRNKALETSLDLYPDIVIDGEDGSVTVLIKHDYYSSDTTHGRDLLLSILNVMFDETNRMYRFIFVDSSVKLFLSDDTLVHKLSTISSQGNSVLICSDSLEYFCIDSDSLGFAEIVSRDIIAFEIVNSNNTIVLS